MRYQISEFLPELKKDGRSWSEMGGRTTCIRLGVALPLPRRTETSMAEPWALPLRLPLRLLLRLLLLPIDGHTLAGLTSSRGPPYVRLGPVTLGFITTVG